MLRPRGGRGVRQVSHLFRRIGARGHKSCRRDDVVIILVPFDTSCRVDGSSDCAAYCVSLPLVVERLTNNRRRNPIQPIPSSLTPVSVPWSDESMALPAAA